MEYLAALIQQFPNQFLFVSMAIGMVSGLGLLVGFIREQGQ